LNRGGDCVGCYGRRALKAAHLKTKTMKYSTILFLLASLMVLNSCDKVIGEGSPVTETRLTGSFTSLESRISGNVYYVQGNDFKIELTAQQNVLNVIETVIVNNNLIVRFKNNVKVGAHDQITIKVTAPNITGINSSGSGNVTVLSPITGNSLSFKLSGSGNMTLPVLTATHLEITTEGSGDISVQGGTAGSEVIKISGSGNVDAEHVLSQSVNTNTSGSGTIRVHAAQALNVTISGSGSVYYAGNPIITTNISGSGSIIHI
jgi:hypothetical protein